MDNQDVTIPATTGLPDRKAAKSTPKPKRGYTKHGLTGVMQAIKDLDLAQLDGRTAIVKELVKECRELINALGGEDEVSPQERSIIRMIAEKRVRRKMMARWALLNRDRLFNKRKMALAPITLQLEQLEESEVRLLDKIGLKRRPKPTKTATELMAKETTPREATVSVSTETSDPEDENRDDRAATAQPGP